MEYVKYKKDDMVSGLTQQQLHDLCIAFRKLKNMELRIFEYLYNRKSYSGNLTSLAKAIGCNEVTNVRKALLSLNKELKIVCIRRAVRDDPENLMQLGSYEGFFLIDGWQENLLKYSKKRKMPRSNIHRKKRSKKQGKRK